jgi:hypothetical protein
MDVSIRYRGWIVMVSYQFAYKSFWGLIWPVQTKNTEHISKQLSAFVVHHEKKQQQNPFAI